MIRVLPALTLLLAGCADSDTMRERSPVPSIVSLNPCTDAILAELTGPDQLLAISHYSKNPAASSMRASDADRFAATGGSVEEVLALDPDIVVASTFIAPATRAAFEGLGIRVETFGGVATVEDSIAQVRSLAELAGKPAEGEQLVNEIGEALDLAKGTGEPVEAALWQPGGIVPGEASLVSDLLRHVGFASYSEKRGMAQADYLSLEQIVVDPPHVLLVAGDLKGQRHPVLAGIPEMRMVGFEPQLIYCGGPTIIRAAERLREIRESVS